MMRPATSERAAAEYLAEKHLERADRAAKRDRVAMFVVACVILAIFAWGIVGGQP